MQVKTPGWIRTSGFGVPSKMLRLKGNRQFETVDPVHGKETNEDQHRPGDSRPKSCCFLTEQSTYQEQSRIKKTKLLMEDSPDSRVHCNCFRSCRPLEDLNLHLWFLQKLGISFGMLPTSWICRTSPDHKTSCCFLF